LKQSGGIGIRQPQRGEFGGNTAALKKTSDPLEQERRRIYLNSMTNPKQPDENSRYDTPEQIRKNFQRWWQAMEVSDAMLMAGLRDRIGPDGDMKEAYRQWNDRRRAAKLRAYEKAGERYSKWLAEQSARPDRSPPEEASPPKTSPHDHNEAN